jgi:hypothetical protein
VREKERVIVGGIVSPTYLKLKELEVECAGSNTVDCFRMKAEREGDTAIFKYMSVELGSVIEIGTEVS